MPPRMARTVAGMASCAALGVLAVPAQAAVPKPEKDPARIVSGPAIAGTPQVGRALTASATWTGADPVRADWQWLRCTDADLRHCDEIRGATASTYTPADADEGSRLRVLLRVTNRDGWAWQLTPATDAVAAAPPPPVPPPPVQPPAVTPPSSPEPPVGAPVTVTPPTIVTAPAAVPRLMRPTPVVRISGWLTRDGAHVTRLTVRAPRGARIAVRCAGRGCPRTRWAHAVRVIHLRPFERIDLRAGVRVTITVTKPGRIGKRTVLVLRRGRPPLRHDRCLYPGSSRPRACPAT